MLLESIVNKKDTRRYYVRIIKKRWFGEARYPSYRTWRYTDTGIYECRYSGSNLRSRVYGRSGTVKDTGGIIKHVSFARKTGR